MGFKDAAWAQEVVIAEGRLAGTSLLAVRAVLIVVAIATNDDSHQTFIGQETIARRTGAVSRTVRRALGVLEELGLIQRERRQGAGGFRTSDLITLLADTYRSPEVLPDCRSGRDPDIPVTKSTPTGHRVHAYRSQSPDDDHPEGHPEDHPELLTDSVSGRPADAFEAFWAAYPRKVKKDAARTAFRNACRAVACEVIVAGAQRFARDPDLPEMRFVPYPAKWLNDARWEDERPSPRIEPARSVVRGGRIVSRLPGEDVKGARTDARASSREAS